MQNAKLYIFEMGIQSFSEINSGWIEPNVSMCKSCEHNMQNINIFLNWFVNMFFFLYFNSLQRIKKCSCYNNYIQHVYWLMKCTVIWFTCKQMFVKKNIQQ